MTNIDPEKLLALRSAWLEKSEASFEAYEKARDLQSETAAAESDFMAYAKHGEDGLQEERQMREHAKSYGLSQGAVAMLGGQPTRAGYNIGAKIKG